MHAAWHHPTSGRTSMIGTLTRRAAYLFERARAVDVRRLWTISERISRVAGRPSTMILFDMLYCSIKYECAFQDYQDWDFAILNHEERASFMTHPKSDRMVRQFNTGSDRFDLADKAKFNARFGESIKREWVDLRTASDEEVRQFLARHQNVMAKVPDALGGAGIERITLSANSAIPKLLRRLTQRGQTLLEELVIQHPDMNALNSSSVNTIRIVTFRRGSDVHVLARVLKIGAGGDVDNFSAGGMYTMLDSDGVSLYPAFDGNDDIHINHPISGTEIVGFRVPFFPELLGLVGDVARQLKDVPYVGWDVAVTPTGPLIIEANYNTGVFQAKPRASGVRTGLRSEYAAAMGT